jgi:hypothetical protein
VRGEVLSSNINAVLQRLQRYDAAHFGRYIPMLRRNVMGNHPENGGRNSLRNRGTFPPNYTGFTYLRNRVFLHNLYPPIKVFMIFSQFLLMNVNQ